jgi:hypothetical protein
MTKVYIIESEAGWGQKVEETLEFPTREEAEKYCREYNNKHNPPRDATPGWYMYARLEGQDPFSGMLR